MSKRNIILRIGVLMLIATLATSGVFVGSGTYAKYTATRSGNAKARVAHFHVEIDDTTFTKVGNQYFDHAEFSNVSHTELKFSGGPLGTLLQPTIAASAWQPHSGGPAVYAHAATCPLAGDKTAAKGATVPAKICSGHADCRVVYAHHATCPFAGNTVVARGAKVGTKTCISHASCAAVSNTHAVSCPLAGTTLAPGATVAQKVCSNHADCKLTIPAGATIEKIDGSLIAPGTGGRLSFVFTNKSEVTVRFWLDSASLDVYTGNLNNDGANIDEIRFAHDNGTGTAPAFGSFGTLAAALGSYTPNATGTRALTLGPWDGVPGNEPSATIGVYWQWPFERGDPPTAQDNKDTKLGETAAGLPFIHATGCTSGPGGAAGTAKTRLRASCVAGCKRSVVNPGTMKTVLKIRAQQVD